MGAQEGTMQAEGHPSSLLLLGRRQNPSQTLHPTQRHISLRFLEGHIQQQASSALLGLFLGRHYDYLSPCCPAESFAMASL